MLDFKKLYLKQLEENKNSRLDFIKQKFSNIEITKQHIVELLQISIIDQWLAEFNYFRSYHLSQTVGKSDFDPEFEQHEKEQEQHRRKIADRIRQLGYRISVLPIIQLIYQNSNGENWKEQTSSNSSKILMNRLNQQKKAVEFYSFFLSIIDKMKEKDTTTYKLIRDIKSDEEQHVKDLTDLAIQHGFLQNVGLISEQYEDQNEPIIITIENTDGIGQTFQVLDINEYANVLDYIIDNFEENSEIDTIPKVLPCDQSYSYNERLNKFAKLIEANKEKNITYNIIKNNYPRIVYGYISFN